MKVFIDTNIFFSAILFPGSMPDKALQKSFCAPYEAYTFDYVINELFRTFIKKFPNKIQSLKTFIEIITSNISVITIDVDYNDKSIIIRDKKDKPIIRAAIQSNCDILLTGDKDLLESGYKKPIITTASDFYQNY